jgi:hypothetical protein
MKRDRNGKAGVDRVVGAATVVEAVVADAAAMAVVAGAAVAEDATEATEVATVATDKFFPSFLIGSNRTERLLQAAAPYQCCAQLEWPV